MKNKRRAASTTATYKPMIPNTNGFQKNNYKTQTDNNKKNNRNTDMSMGLEDKKKLKTKTIDQKEEKLSSPKEAVTTTAPSSQLATPPESEVFDSSSDNAMSEMKRVADMEPDEANKVFSHLEEQQQLGPSTASVDDTVRKTETENSSEINPAKANQTLQERDHNEMKSKKEDVILMRDVKPDIPQDQEFEKQDRLGESVRFSDELNKDHSSTSFNNDNKNKNTNPFISGMKLWQDYNTIWLNAYNEYMKTWNGMFKTIC
jgi:hypothetical protein